MHWLQSLSRQLWHPREGTASLQVGRFDERQAGELTLENARIHNAQDIHGP